MSIWRWDSLLTAPPLEHRITLGEGNTPLIASRRIGPASGLPRLWWKLETVNPSGSYKDRFAAAAISHMLASRKSLCVATSSGNTGASLAAYCAAAAIRCKIALVETAPPGKLIQMLVHGAQLLRVKGFGLDSAMTQQTFDILKSIGNQPDVALQISAYCYSPVGMKGVQTISYELAEQMQEINHMFVPGGGGGLTLAIARGFNAMVKTHRLKRSPRVHCVQPIGNNTIAGPLREGCLKAQQVACTTRISGLQVPSILDGNEVITACRASGGKGYLVNDAEVYEAQRRLACNEGIFCEPAAAVALAGALQAAEGGEISPEETVVCLVTGSGFKDMASAESMTSNTTCSIVDPSQLEVAIRDTFAGYPSISTESA